MLPTGHFTWPTLASLVRVIQHSSCSIAVPNMHLLSPFAREMWKSMGRVPQPLGLTYVAIRRRNTVLVEHDENQFVFHSWVQRLVESS